MNPHFSRTTEAAEPPLRLLAQVDSLVELEDGLFLLRWDAVPLRWAEEHIEREALAEMPPERISELLSIVPIFHLEMTIDIRSYRWRWLSGGFWPFEPHLPWAGELGEWLELDFEPMEGGDVLSYSSALAEPVEGTVTSGPADTRLVKFLDALNPNVIHATRDHPKLLATLADLPCPLYFAVLDIGQGSANVMLDEEGRPIFYFDVGRGIYGNKSTLPGKAEFCTCPRAKDLPRPPVLLSHWDYDHWAGAVDDPDLLQCTWITPPPTTIKHASFQSEVINAGGAVIELGSGFSRISFGSGNHSTLLHCTGRSRNDSGNALVIQEGVGRWLFPGDASYQYIPLISDWTFVALVATHHGARFKGAVPQSTNHYTRLVYSFGPNNTHGKTLVRHPVLNAVQKHNFQWSHTNWLLPAVSPGSVAPLPTESVRATAINDSSGTHLGSVLVGWASVPPSFLFKMKAPCAGCHKSFNIQQS